jgi:hypothetical protein
MTAAPTELTHRSAAIDGTFDLIASLDADDWERPTPCADTPVGNLVAHAVGGLQQFGGIPSDAAFDATEPALELARASDHPSIRVPGMFGPAADVDADAPVIDRPTALLGRRPEWVAPG